MNYILKTNEDELPKSVIDTLTKAKEIFTDYMVAKSLRKTPERFAILEVIYTSDGHFDVDNLYLILKDKKYRVSRATVYNTLDLLVDCGLVVRHQFGSATALFEKSYGFKQHDHLICNKCGKVLEFCDPRIQNIKKMVEDFYNFTITSHTLQFFGTCNDDNCIAKKETKK